MLSVLNSGARDSRVTTSCVQLDVFNPNASDSATNVDIDGVDVSETLELAQPDTAYRATDLSADESLEHEVVDVFEELTVPPSVAENSARVERRLTFADEDGLPGRATKGSGVSCRATSSQACRKRGSATGYTWEY